MKGLLIKDFKLMMMQKNFFAMIVVIAVVMTVFTDDIAFPLGFLTFVVSMFTLSTISYDEFDNGNAFLFSLPVSRSGYVVEKYCLALLLGGGAWIFATVLAMGAVIIRKIMPAGDLVVIALFILPVMLMMQAVMLPIQLKFGGEKGRIALIGASGLAVGLAAIIVKGAGTVLHIDLVKGFAHLQTVSVRVLILSVAAVAVVLLLASMKISIAVVKKKEF